MIDQVQVEAMVRDSQADEYRLRTLAFESDVIYDIGACVGSFTLFAASIFPKSVIVAVEPEPDNYATLVKNTAHLPNVVTIQAALSADAEVHRCPTSPGIGNWIFNSPSSPTYTEDWPVCDVPVVTLDELVAQYGGDRYLVKLDCESGELMVVTHQPSRNAAWNAAYLVGEFHLWGTTHKMLQEMLGGFLWWLYELSTTHNVDVQLRGGVAMIYATKRVTPGQKNDWQEVLRLQREEEERHG